MVFGKINFCPQLSKITPILHDTTTKLKQISK